LEYEQYQDLLEQAGSPGDVADVHGALCGVLCGGGDALAELWLQDVVADCEAGPERIVLIESMQELGLSTWQNLSATGLEFDPLLPDSDAELAQSVESLAGWCQGFLYGLGRAGITEDRLSEGVVGEVVADFVELSKATDSDEDDPVESGFALAELVEYVRVSTQLVFEELLPLRQAPPQLH
jgi:uncharacterized protein YgfB (UPF0149 family)